MRLSPGSGKKDCHIIDFADAMNRIPGLVCTPTLFGLDPETIIDGMTFRLISGYSHGLHYCLPDESTETLESRVEASFGGTPDSNSDIPEPSGITYIDYENPFALVNQASGVSPHIIRLSQNAWVGCGDDIYVLECLGKGHIRIEPSTNDEGLSSKALLLIFVPINHH